MKTILFDLDGTLLPMDQDGFIKAYFGALATKMLPQGYDPQLLIQGIWEGTEAMVRNPGDITNEECFWAGFAHVVGTDCRKDAPIFDDFYRNEFRFVAASCGFDPHAVKVIRWLQEQGCRIILATNPIFPAIATYNRIQWAGLDPSDFELITTYENSRHCKPNPEYYRDILKQIGERPENCIMVGNDVTEDMIAQDLGMDVFLVTNCLINKHQRDITQYPQGDLQELMAYLKQHL